MPNLGGLALFVRGGGGVAWGRPAQYALDKTHLTAC